MNYLRGADLRVGDVVYIPNSIGQWSQTTDKITSIISGDLSGMLTLYLEKGLSFRVYPNTQVPFVPVAEQVKQKEKTPMDNTNTIRDALVGIYTLRELQLLKRALSKQLDDLIDEERRRPSQTIEQLEEFNRRLHEWIKINAPISAAIIYLEGGNS